MIPANDHAQLTDRQQHEWPIETLRNPDGSPLLRASGAIRGWLDVLRLVIDRSVGWVPAFLEKLDKTLTRDLGPHWWTKLTPDEPPEDTPGISE